MNPKSSSSSRQIMFYAPWCEHCKALMPSYEAAARSLGDWSVPLAKVDGTENKELADRFGAAGWPTLKVLNRGTVFDYGGSRDKGTETKHTCSL